MSIDAYEMDAVESVIVSEDGRQIILIGRDSDKSPINLAIPEHQIIPLMVLGSQGASQARKILGSNTSAQHILPCEGYDFGILSDQDHQNQLILSFRVQGGIQLAFRLPMNEIPHLIQALQATAGDATPPPPDVLRQ